MKVFSPWIWRSLGTFCFLLPGAAGCGLLPRQNVADDLRKPAAEATASAGRASKSVLSKAGSKSEKSGAVRVRPEVVQADADDTEDADADVQKPARIKLTQGLNRPKDKASENGRSYQSIGDRIKLPKPLPGSDVPPITLPPSDQFEEYSRALNELFPALPGVAPIPQYQPEPGAPPLTLRELEAMAMQNNPTIAQYAADIQGQIGTAIQAGAYPNPTVGFEEDTVGSAGTRNYQGGFFTQQIKTAGKLGLQVAVENVELQNTQLALRKARLDLSRRVRVNYFAVLVAKESLIYSQALVRFTDAAYNVQLDQLKVEGAAEVAAYEPMQLRVFAIQARGALIQAQNRHMSAWRQLAATLGLPKLPPAELSGNPDMPIAIEDYETALGYVLENHTDVITARNSTTSARLKLRIEEIKPIPDVNLYSAIQKDFTTPPHLRTTYNLQVGVPVPIFDRNRGNIIDAQSNVIRATREVENVRLNLTIQMADAYERYANNRMLLENYRTKIIPDQSRAYQAINERHQQEPEAVGFGDVVVAQQALLNSITTYIVTLNQQLQAVADIAALLQVEDLSELERGVTRQNEGMDVPPPESPPVTDKLQQGDIGDQGMRRVPAAANDFEEEAAAGEDENK